ncbi:MAG: GNAT family N-acetyltransferase [Bacteroidales bacterium]|mgnify:CR=1 FL=1|nr:GNAT family N-acetyltransferase [Bacteroidales bacterium]
MEIRLIRNGDFQQYRTDLIRLFNIALSLNFPNVNPEVEALSYFEKMYTFFTDGSAIIFVAFDGKNLAGFNWAHEVNKLGQKRLHSAFIVVDEKYQKRGVAKELLVNIEKEAKQRGIRYIEALCSVSNEAAVNYHLRNGFTVERLKVVKKLK